MKPKPPEIRHAEKLSFYRSRASECRARLAADPQNRHLAEEAEGWTRLAVAREKIWDGLAEFRQSCKMS